MDMIVNIDPNFLSFNRVRSWGPYIFVALEFVLDVTQGV